MNGDDYGLVIIIAPDNPVRLSLGSRSYGTDKSFLDWVWLLGKKSRSYDDEVNATRNEADMRSWNPRWSSAENSRYGLAQG